MAPENLNKLQSVINSLCDAKVPKIFFNLLREFANELFTNSLYKPGIKKIKRSEEKDKIKMKEFEKQVLKIQKEIYDKLKQYIDENDLNTHLMVKLFDFFNNPTGFNGSIIADKLFVIDKILTLFHDDPNNKHSNFLEKELFAKFCEDGTLKEYDLIRPLLDYDTERDNLNKLKPCSAWHSLKEVAEFYFCDGSDIKFFIEKTKREKEGKDIERMVELREQLHLRPNSEGFYRFYPDFECYEDFLDMEEYKMYAVRIFDFIKIRTTKKRVLLLEKRSAGNISYHHDSKTGAFCVDNDELPRGFKTNDNPNKLLKLMTKNKQIKLDLFVAYEVLFDREDALDDREKIKKISTNKPYL